MTSLVFDKYLIVRRLAIGGMGEIFLAKQTGVAGFDRLVILKSLLPDLAESKDAVREFLEEARVAALLNHPNIVAIHEVGLWEGAYFIAMEYIAGDNLSAILKAVTEKGTRLPVAATAFIIRDAALALDHAHRARGTDGAALELVHRDVSPHNIMVRTDGVTKVVDFGIAKARNRSVRTETGLLKGKLHYMSPEQVKNEPLDGRSDQFSLGVVLWEALTGQRLFKKDASDGSSELEDARHILEAPIPPPSTFDPEIPEVLDAIALRMLERDRARRFPRCADVASALGEYLDKHARGFGQSHVASLAEWTIGERVKERTRDLRPSEENFLVSLRRDSGTSSPSGRTRPVSKNELRAPARRRRALLLTGSVLTALAFVVVAGIAGNDLPRERRVEATRGAATAASREKILRLNLAAQMRSVDPVRCSSNYENQAVVAIYEPLLQYNYLARPYRLEPNLLERMPEVSAEGRTYMFVLKRGVLFHDDRAFPDGRGREMTSADVIYSIKRMANSDFTPEGAWIYRQRIRGFEAYEKTQAERKAGTPFDYDAPVEGLEIVDRYRFRLHLIRPSPQILNVLAMCYAAVVPREAVERYGAGIGEHPVGSGPFQLEEPFSKTRLVLRRNPTYRDERYPGLEHDAADDDAAAGRLAYANARVPFLDRVVLEVVEEEPVAWLRWRAGELDLIHVAAASYESAFDERGRLRSPLAEDGVGERRYAMLDFVHLGFNMEDPVLGGFGSGKLVRQAIALALDEDAIAAATGRRGHVVYDGPIPPGLDGYAPGIRSPYRGPDLEKSKALLARAGYPEGRGLPPIEYYNHQSSISMVMARVMASQLRRVGIEQRSTFLPYPELEAVRRERKAQTFGYAWMSDYPDAENNLALFYGPNAERGSNLYGYRNPEYDALYERASAMPPSPERTRLYEKMRDIIIEDCPAIDGFARERRFLWSKHVHVPKPDEMFYTWIKYVDVDPRE